MSCILSSIYSERLGAPFGLVLSAVLLAGGGCGDGTSPPGEGAAKTIRIATTTSTQNSGLLDYLLPRFTEVTGIRVRVVAVGTGAALRLAGNGDVDAVIVHAPELEEEFVRKGLGVNRRTFMHNDFVVLGPKEDPAGIRGLTGAVGAFRRIRAAGALFVSRGDNSGTHVKELSLWKEAGGVPEGGWYLEAGQGMGAVLVMASERGAYTLSDRGTFLAFRDRLGLEVMVEGDPSLRNPYSVIVVNPERLPGVKFREAMRLEEFLVSEEGRRLIASFRVKGEALFHPDPPVGGGEEDAR